jgi:hypothetical protein
VGAFSGAENSKMWGLSPEIPKTGSPLAKGELPGKRRAYSEPAKTGINTGYKINIRTAKRTLIHGSRRIVRRTGVPAQVKDKAVRFGNGNFRYGRRKMPWV